MSHSSPKWLLPSAIVLLALVIQCSQALFRSEDKIKSEVFLSPLFVMTPGSVVNRYYHNIKFPRGHIALKSFNAEVVDDAGRPIPLQDTYLHHWAIARYYRLKDAEVPKDSQMFQKSDFHAFRPSDLILVRNSGVCQGNSLGQYFGLGSETRKTSTYVPDPYGIEVGNPAEIPDGYEESWMLNVHAIDTRGVEDRSGCTECRCNLYNVTKDEYGRTLKQGYEGGLYCCYDQTQCRVKQWFGSASRNLYMRYTVEWVDWDSSIVPVKIYVFDVTDSWKRMNDSTSLNERHNCKVEYEIERCSATDEADGGCIDTKRTRVTMRNGGYVIYGVAHQHSGGTGSALYGEDGRLICASMPTYGTGKEAGNEANYIVGMSTCYPEPGSVQISDGETLILESNYSSSQHHTGVMGLFYLLVADQAPKPLSSSHGQVTVTHGSIKLAAGVWMVAVVGAAVLAIAVAVVYARRNGRGDVYQSLAA